MSGANKRVIRPNLGSALRPRGKTPRKHFLTVDVTKEEQQAILQYCLQNKISVSQFLADLVLEDAARPQPGPKQKVLVKVEFELTQAQYEKLELLARLHKKNNIGDLLQELLMPNLDLERPHAPLETMALRYYLSQQEHEIITRHVARKGFSASNYVAMLALKAISQPKKRK
jgi:hypothetical protein